MLLARREGRKLLSYLESMKNLKRPLLEEEKEMLAIKYGFFKQLIAHKFKWGNNADYLEALKIAIDVDNLYFNKEVNK